MPIEMIEQFDQGTQIIKRCIGHERILADVATLSRGLADKKLQEL